MLMIHAAKNVTAPAIGRGLWRIPGTPLEQFCDQVRRETDL
jgi:hypothetical protein